MADCKIISISNKCRRRQWLTEAAKRCDHDVNGDQSGIEIEVFIQMLQCEQQLRKSCVDCGLLAEFVFSSLEKANFKSQ
ncbi:MAG: hypothetical protein A2178_01450 [Planctomycetes bacterium GWC2_49_10]|nr:MAG: hypothetical protein A2178_01450 [Planctomycetes bacterium GWC2_49_10]